MRRFANVSKVGKVLEIPAFFGFSAVAYRCLLTGWL
jgi:hypothetical protein